MIAPTAAIVPGTGVVGSFCGGPPTEEATTRPCSLLMRVHKNSSHSPSFVSGMMNSNTSNSRKGALGHDKVACRAYVVLFEVPKFVMLTVQLTSKL